MGIVYVERFTIVFVQCGDVQQEIQLVSHLNVILYRGINFTHLLLGVKFDSDSDNSDPSFFSNIG